MQRQWDRLLSREGTPRAEVAVSLELKCESWLEHLKG